MATESIRTRRKFAGEWDEIKYLYDKLLFWLYERDDRRKSRPICDRLEPLLKKVAAKGEAILGEECWSLVYEVRREFGKAIQHRRREIELITRLLRGAERAPNRESIFRLCDYSDLSDRYDLLAILYHDAGDLDRAIETLRESKRLCKKHRIEFDAQDILDDYLAEKPSRPMPLIQSPTVESVSRQRSAS